MHKPEPGPSYVVFGALLSNAFDSQSCLMFCILSVGPLLVSRALKHKNKINHDENMTPGSVIVTVGSGPVHCTHVQHCH